MTTRAFAGVEVDIPTSLAGIQFAFKGGVLAIQCTNFTGSILLAPSGAIACLRVDIKADSRSREPKAATHSLATRSFVA